MLHRVWLPCLLNGLLHHLVIRDSKSTLIGTLSWGTAGVLFKESDLSSVWVLEVANLVGTVVFVATLLLNDVVESTAWHGTVVTTLASNKGGGVTSATVLVGATVVELTLFQRGGWSSAATSRLGWSLVVWRRVGKDTLAVGTLLVGVTPFWNNRLSILVGWGWVAEWAHLLGANSTVLTHLNTNSWWARGLGSQKSWHMLLDLLQKLLLLSQRLASSLDRESISLRVGLADKVLAALGNTSRTSSHTWLGDSTELTTALDTLLELDVSSSSWATRSTSWTSWSSSSRSWSWSWSSRRVLGVEALKTTNLSENSADESLVNRDSNDLLDLSNDLVSWTAIANQHDNVLSDILSVVSDLVLGSKLSDEKRGELLSDRAFWVEHCGKKK